MTLLPADDEFPAAPHPTPAEPTAGEAIPTSAPPATSLPKVVPFTALARCGDEVWIENGGQIYRLRRTRQGKLILTK